MRSLLPKLAYKLETACPTKNTNNLFGEIDKLFGTAPSPPKYQQPF
jgi:hypothetical protein